MCCDLPWTSSWGSPNTHLTLTYVTTLVPTLPITQMDYEDQFLVIASDGIWDVLDNQALGLGGLGKICLVNQTPGCSFCTSPYHIG